MQVEFGVLPFIIRKLCQYRAEPVEIAYLFFPPPDVYLFTPRSVRDHGEFGLFLQFFFMLIYSMFNL